MNPRIAQRRPAKPDGSSAGLVIIVLMLLLVFLVQGAQAIGLHVIGLPRPAPAFNAGSGGQARR